MLEGKWSDNKNLSRALNMIDEIKGLEARGFTTDEIMEYLPEVEVEWLKEFFSAFVVDLQQFIQAMAKIAADFLNAVASNLTDILGNVARAQKDVRTRAYGAPAVAFQAPVLPEGLNGGIVAGFPGISVQGEGITTQINHQLDALAREQQGVAIRRNRYER